MDVIVPKIQSISSTRFLYYFSRTTDSFREVAFDCVDNGHITTFIISYYLSRDKYTIAMLDKTTGTFVRIRKESK